MLTGQPCRPLVVLTAGVLCSRQVVRHAPVAPPDEHRNDGLDALGTERQRVARGPKPHEVEVDP
eukprot:5405897-Heterocapsa_arctica.AAC.1